MDVQGKSRQELMDELAGLRQEVSWLRQWKAENQKVRKELAQTQSRLQTMIYKSNDAIFTTDVDRKVTDCNPAFLRMFGFRRNEIIGRSIRFIHTSDESYKDFGRAIYPNLNRKGSWRGEWWFQRKDQTPIILEIAISAQRRPGEGMYDYLSVARDITERKEVEEALAERERWLKQMTDNVPVIIAYIDIDRKFRFINRTFEKWLGKDNAQILNRSVPDVLGREVYEAIKEYMDRAFSGHEVRYERDSKDSQGRDIVLRLIYVPHRNENGAVIGYFAVGTDITAHRLAQQEETKHQRMEAALETARAVCHEINQPLQALMSEAELLQLREWQDPEAQEKLERMIVQTERLANFAQKLLKLTRYEAKEYPGGVNILDLDRSID